MSLPWILGHHSWHLTILPLNLPLYKSQERNWQWQAFAFPAFLAAGCERRPVFSYPDTPAWTKSAASDKNKTELEGPLWQWWQLQGTTEGCQGQKWCSAGCLGKARCQLGPWHKLKNLSSILTESALLCVWFQKTFLAAAQILTSMSRSPGDCMSCPKSFQQIHFWLKLNQSLFMIEPKTMTDNTIWVELFTTSNCAKFSLIPRNIQVFYCFYVFSFLSSLYTRLH